MKRLHANVGSRNPALEKRPEVLKAIGVYAAIYVLRGMVNNLMRIIGRQSVIGQERIAIERRTSRDMLAYLFLQYSLATARHDSWRELFRHAPRYP